MLDLLMQNNFDLDDLIKLGVFVVVAIASGLGSLLKKKSSKDEVEVEVLEEDDGWIEVESDTRRKPGPLSPPPVAKSSMGPASAVPGPSKARQSGSTTPPPPSAAAQSRRARTPRDRSASVGRGTVPPAPPAPVRGRTPAQGPSRDEPTPPPPQRRPSTPARTVSTEQPPLEARHLQPHPGYLEAAMQTRRISRVEGEHLRPHFESPQPEEHAADSGHGSGRAGAGEIRLRLARGDLRHAVILSEILAPPLALRSHSPGS